MRRTLVIAFILMSIQLGAVMYADGESIELTLDDAIARALSHSKLVIHAQQSLDNAHYEVTLARTRTPRMSISTDALAAKTTGMDPESKIIGTRYSSQSYAVNVDLPMSRGLNIGILSSARHRTTNSEIRGEGGMEYTFADAYTGAVFSLPIGVFRDERVLTDGSRLSAKLWLQRAELALDDVQRRVILETLQYYLSAARAQRREEIAVATLAEADELLRIAQEEQKLGRIPEIDVMEAKVSSDAARTSVRRHRSAATTALDRLKNYLGMPFDVFARLTNPVTMDVLSLSSDEERLVEFAMEERADLRQLAIQIESAELALRQAEARSRPRVALTGRYGLSGEGSTIFDGFGSLINPTWSVGVVTSMGLTRYEGRINIDQARDRLHLATLEEQLYKDEIRLEIRRLLRELEDAEANAELLANTIHTAEENLRIRRVQFQRGLARPVDVMQTERQLAEVRQRHADAAIDFQLAQALLNLAVGNMPVSIGVRQ